MENTLEGKTIRKIKIYEMYNTI